MEVEEGSWFVYSTQSSAAYRIFDMSYQITVTSLPSETALSTGNWEQVTSDDDEWVNATDNDPIENVKLVPYVINIQSNLTELDITPENCPLSGYDGLNVTEIDIVTNWDVDHVEFPEKGQTFVDRERLFILQTFDVNYTVEGKDTGSINAVNASITYMWDIETGILLQRNITLFSNDTTLDGTIITKLIDTSLWELETGGIPGFSVGTLLSTVILTSIMITHIIKKKMHFEEEK